MGHGLRKLARSAPILGALCGLAALAPSSAQETRWRRLGGPGIDAGFAGPVGGPILRTWFSADGRRLHAAAADGALWASEDLGQTWAPSEERGPEAALASPPGAAATGPGPPELIRDPYRPHVVYALGEHLYRSDDGGGEWINLTALGRESVIGRWQASLAISPMDPDVIVVGNAKGLWKSYDGGVSWASLNRSLPNFPPVRFRQTRLPANPRLEAASLGILELARGSDGPRWRVIGPPPRRTAAIPPSERVRLARPEPAAPPGYAASYRIWRDGEPISGALTECDPEQGCEDPAGHSVTVLADNGRLWAGTSNGRIWVSRDGGGAWLRSWLDPDEGEVRSLWADPARPSAALAIVGARILRSTDEGASWTDIGADLPVSAWTDVIGHPQAGIVYVAGPLGVYFAQVDLAWPSAAGAWTPISASLPTGDVRDLALDPLRGRLYAALPGHGVFWARTPRVEQALRALSAADLSARPAAPGSLLTILGADAIRAQAGGRPAPILDSGQGQTQLQLPFALDGREVRLLLEERNARHVVELPLAEVSPAIFVVNGEALLLDAGAGTLIAWNRPVAPGGSLLAMATGLGRVEPPLAAGIPSPEEDPPEPVAPIGARINGLPVPVLSAHLAGGYIGIYIVEVRVPAGAEPGRSSLSLEAAGRTSNQVGLFIGRR